MSFFTSRRKLRGRPGTTSRSSTEVEALLSLALAVELYRSTGKSLRVIAEELGVSLGFGQAARDAGIAVSMGSRGDCYDNAVAESFFATLKKELIYREGPWRTRRDLGTAVFDYIEVFYNQRRHSTLGYLSPEQFEKDSPSIKMNSRKT